MQFGNSKLNGTGKVRGWKRQIFPLDLNWEVVLDKILLGPQGTPIQQDSHFYLNEGISSHIPFLYALS